MKCQSQFLHSLKAAPINPSLWYQCLFPLVTILLGFSLPIDLATARISLDEISDFRCQRQTKEGLFPFSCSAKILSRMGIDIPLACPPNQIKSLSRKDLITSLQNPHLRTDCRARINSEIRRRNYIAEGLPKIHSGAKEHKSFGKNWMKGTSLPTIWLEP